MGNHISAGQQCVVLRDVVVEGQYAFKKGERLVVEKISPNPERPEYKYVVYSNYLQKRFQLSYNDLASLPLKQVSAAVPVKARKTGFWVLLAAGGAVLATAIVYLLLVFLAGGTSGPVKTVDQYHKAISKRDTTLLLDTMYFPEELKQTANSNLKKAFSSETVKYGKLDYRTEVKGKTATVRVYGKHGEDTAFNLTKRNGKWCITDSAFIDTIRGQYYTEKAAALLERSATASQLIADYNLGIAEGLLQYRYVTSQDVKDALLTSMVDTYLPKVQQVYNDTVQIKSEIEELTPVKCSWFDLGVFHDLTVKGMDLTCSANLELAQSLELLRGVTGVPTASTVDKMEQALNHSGKSLSLDRESSTYIEQATEQIRKQTEAISQFSPGWHK